MRVDGRYNVVENNNFTVGMACTTKHDTPFLTTAEVNAPFSENDILKILNNESAVNALAAVSGVGETRPYTANVAIVLIIGAHSVNAVLAPFKNAIVRRCFSSVARVVSTRPAKISSHACSFTT